MRFILPFITALVVGAVQASVAPNDLEEHHGMVILHKRQTDLGTLIQYGSRDKILARSINANNTLTSDDDNSSNESDDRGKEGSKPCTKGCPTPTKPPKPTTATTSNPEPRPTVIVPDNDVNNGHDNRLCTPDHLKASITCRHRYEDLRAEIWMCEGLRAMIAETGGYLNEDTHAVCLDNDGWNQACCTSWSDPLTIPPTRWSDLLPGLDRIIKECGQGGKETQFAGEVYDYMLDGMNCVEQCVKWTPKHCKRRH